MDAQYTPARLCRVTTIVYITRFIVVSMTAIK